MIESTKTGYKSQESTVIGSHRFCVAPMLDCAVVEIKVFKSEGYKRGFFLVALFDAVLQEKGV